MDRERFQRNEIYYIIGMVCLCVGLSLFALSFYILPNLAFGWRYEMPSFIPLWSNILQESYKLSMNASAWFVFLGLFFPALLLVVIADILSHRIEKKMNFIEEDKLTKKRATVNNTESSRLIIKMIVIIVLVFITAQFFQWIISTSPLPKAI